jgi:hypothetical protein
MFAIFDVLARGVSEIEIALDLLWVRTRSKAGNPAMIAILAGCEPKMAKFYPVSKRGFQREARWQPKPRCPE